MGCTLSKRANEASAPVKVPQHNESNPQRSGSSDRLAAVKVPQDRDEIKRIGEELAWIINNGVEERLRLTCWDYAGQDTFYGLHHLYMGRQSVYVLMFNMEWFLKGAQISEKSEHIAFLMFWLDSIALHAVDPRERDPVAPIILVGTHKEGPGVGTKRPPIHL